MKILYWSDYSCPYCYIGEARLKKALMELNIFDRVAVEMKAFQLDPNARKKSVGDTITRFAHKYGITKAQAKEQIDNISKIGIAEGLDFKYDTTLFTNTMDAHRLTKYVASKGNKKLKEQIIAELFKAYFTHNLELADKNVLIKIAAKVGVSKDEAEHIINSDKFKNEVIADEQEATMNGIHGVPYFIIDNYEVSGAVSVDMLKDSILRVIKENSSRSIDNQVSPICDSDGCRIQ